MSSAQVYPFPSRLTPEQREAVPLELRQRPQWVRYKFTEPNSHGKRGKRPWHPVENRAASSTDPGTWGDFGDALENAGRDGTHGIGFVFTADDPFCGIDLDGCFDPHTWKLSDFAQQLVDSFATYTEASPSQTGIHLIGRGTLPPNSRKTNARVEVYDRGRFFCVTGGCIQDPVLPLRDIQPELDALLEQELGSTAGAGDDAAAGATPPPRDQDGWGPPPGTPRHDWLCSQAAGMASHGYPAEAILGALRGWRDQLPGDRPIPDSELESLARSAVAKFGKVAAADPTDPEAVDTILGARVTLDGWRTAQPVLWYVDSILAPGVLTALSAQGGRKKSLLAQSLYIHLAAGCPRPWLGTFRTVRDPLRVLVLDGECGKKRLERRLREMVLGGLFSAEDADRALASLDFRTIGSIQTPALALDTLAVLLERQRCDVVVIDPLRFFLPSGVKDENDNLGMGAVLDKLKALVERFQVSILVIAHDSAAGKALRGASSQQNAVECMWHLDQPDEEDRNYLVLANEKDRDPGSRTKIAIQVVGQECVPEGGGHLYPLALQTTKLRVTEKAADKASAKSARWAAIVCAVEAHYRDTGAGASPAAVASATGGAPRTVARDLADLADRQLLYHPDGRSGYYPAGARGGADA